MREKREKEVKICSKKKKQQQHTQPSWWCDPCAMTSGVMRQISAILTPVDCTSDWTHQVGMSNFKEKMNPTFFSSDFLEN